MRELVDTGAAHFARTASDENARTDPPEGSSQQRSRTSLGSASMVPISASPIEHAEKRNRRPYLVMSISTPALASTPDPERRAKISWDSSGPNSDPLPRRPLMSSPAGKEPSAPGDRRWTDAEIRCAFDHFDANKSGRMDGRELRAALRFMRFNVDDREARRVLQSHDAGGDGLLELDEFTRLVRQLPSSPSAPGEEEWPPRKWDDPRHPTPLGGFSVQRRMQEIMRDQEGEPSYKAEMRQPRSHGALPSLAPLPKAPLDPRITSGAAPPSPRRATLEKVRENVPTQEKGFGGGLKRAGLKGLGGGVLGGLKAQREEQVQLNKVEAREEQARAGACFGARDWTGSVNHLNAALGKARSESLLRLRARSKLRAGDPRDGGQMATVDDAKAALAFDPRRAENYRLLGVAQTQEGRLSEAGRSYLQGMEIAPADLLPHYHAGISTLAGRDSSAQDASRPPPTRTAAAAPPSQAHGGDTSPQQPPEPVPTGISPASFEGYPRLLARIQRERAYYEAPPPRKYGRTTELRNPHHPCSVAMDEGRPVSLAQESSVLNSMGPPHQPPKLRCELRGEHELEIAWDDPEDDGGDEVFEWVVECSRDCCEWDEGPSAGRGAFFEGWRPYAVWHHGPAYDNPTGGKKRKVCSRIFDNLRKDHAFRFRAKCRNSLGDSPFSEVLEVRTRRTPALPLERRQYVPWAWLTTDLSDLLALDAPRRAARREAALRAPPPSASAEGAPTREEEEDRAARKIQKVARGRMARVRRGSTLAGRALAASAFTGEERAAKRHSARPLTLDERRARRDANFGTGASDEELLADLRQALEPYRETLDRLFRHCCLTNRGPDAQHVDILESMGQAQFRHLVKSCGLYDDALGPSDGERAKKVDVIFARANVDEREGAAPTASGAEPPPPAAEDDGGENLMVMREFVNALLRIADLKYSEAGWTLVQRMEELLERHVMPYAESVLRGDPLGDLLRSRRVRAIIDRYKAPLKEVFDYYAAADNTSEDARDNMGSLNLAEVLFFLKEGNLFDPARLSHAQVARIFAQCNLPDELDEHDELTKEDWEEEDAESDENEISYKEFGKLLARVCNSKIPLENRDGSPFELTLNNWLGLQIVPMYTRIVKDKKRGIGQTFSAG